MRDPEVEVAASALDQQEVFVGPRPFERSEKNLFFGRDREISELLSLVTSNRVVLCYAPSGAGKTSLINAGLQPRLEKEGFEVLPSTRVRGLIPEGVDQKDVANIYIFNAILSLSKETRDVSELAHSTLAEFLSTVPHLTDAEDFPSPRILIFDQFEELLTSYLERWQERDGFFHQVRDALQADPLLRVLFVMREDYVARIEPFMRILKPLQQTRFRLDLLGPSGAQAAVTGPLRGTPRRFKDGAVDSLIEELRKVRVESTHGEATEVIGEYVEPVQLQVVCRNLWNSLPANVQEISQEHLKAYGDVDQALRDFYESCLTGARTSLRTNEAALRQWFERQLITPAGTRSIVFRDAQQTAGLSNAVVDFLENRHVIRGEWRAGSRWYELTHDRLIEPIQRANERWRSQRQARRNRILGFAGGTVVLVLMLFAIFLSFRSGASYAAPADSTAVAAITSVYQNATLAVEAQSTTVAIRADASLSKSRQLAAESLLVNDQELSLLLAIEANNAFNTAEARRSLHKILSQQGRIDGEFLREFNPQIFSPTLVNRLNNPNGNWVISVAFSPNGSQFVSGGQAGTLMLWDISSQDGNGIPLAGHSGDILSVAFSPDGRLVASAGGGGQILLWNASDGTPYDLPLQGHRGLVRSLSFSPDGKLLASAGADGSVLIWDLTLRDSPEQPRIMETDHKDVWSVAWSPDGKLLATAGADSLIRIWETQSFTKLHELSGHAGLVWSIAWSPDGQSLASTSGSVDLTNGEIIIWDAINGTMRQRPPVIQNTPTSRRIAFDPSGKMLVVCRDDGVILFWDIQLQKVSYTLRAHRSRVMSLAYSPDGQYMISGSVDGTVAVWNLLAPTGSLAASPAGDILATSQGSVISLWDTAADTTDPMSVLVGHKDDILALAFSPDGSLLASSALDNTIRIWEPQTGQSLASFSTTGAVLSLDISPDNQFLASGFEDGSVLLWDLGGGGQSHGFVENHGPIVNIQFAEDGKSLRALGKDGGLFAWDLTANAPEQEALPGTQGVLASIAISQGGQKAAYFREGGSGETAILSNEGRAHGIAISSWDQSFDPTVNRDDIDFIIIKATEGTQYVDPKFEEYVNTIQSIPMRGVFHYFRETEPWKEQADHFLATVKDKGFHFYILDLEVMPKRDSTDFLADAEQWLEYVDQQVQGQVVLETGSSYLEQFGAAGDWMNDWPLLVLQYPITPDRNGNPLLPQGFPDWRIWNYTEKGSGAEYGVGADNIYLVVYNGTPVEMGQWLGINAFSIFDRDSEKVVNPKQPLQVTNPSGLDFSPDGSYLAVADDGAVSLLNTSSGDEISTLTVRGRSVLSLDFLPNGDALAIGTDDGVVLLWDLTLLQEATDTQPFIKIACTQAQRDLTREEWVQYVGSEGDYESTCDLPVR